MARAGLVWDRTDQKERDKMRQLWRSLVERFDHGGYMLGTGPLAEAPAGDTIEILEVVKGDGKKHGGIHVRASARFVEAYRKTKGGGRTATVWITPLCRNSSRAGDDRQRGT